MSIQITEIILKDTIEIKDYYKTKTSKKIEIPIKEGCIVDNFLLKILPYRE